MSNNHIGMGQDAMGITALALGLGVGLVGHTLAPVIMLNSIDQCSTPYNEAGWPRLAATWGKQRSKRDVPKLGDTQKEWPSVQSLTV